MDLKAIDRYIEIPLKIGKFIINNSLFKVEDLIWNKTKLQSNQDENLMRYEDIDVGVSGLILFLIELNKAKPNARLEMSLNNAGFELIEHCKAIQRTHYGFYCGRGGVCYTLAELSEATREKRFLDFAMELIKNESDTYINSEFCSNNLYEGRAGLLLVLLHLYNISHEKWIIEKIKVCLLKIIRNFLITDQGIVWNRLDNNIQPLNSFFYGSAGVAFVLQRLAGVSGDPELFSLAKALFQYIDKDWSEKISAWPDYRNEIKTVDDFISHKTNFLNKEYDFFTKGSQSFDIANGTAGICIARLPFLELDGDTLFNRITLRSISKLSNSKIKDLSLAEGLPGIGSLYVEANRHLKNQVILERALKVADALNIKNYIFDNLSLFYGTTGVGYFLLQLLNTKDSQSILYPVVKNRNRIRERGISNADTNLLITAIFRSTFPYTFFVIKSFSLDYSLDLIEKYHFSLAENPLESMQRFISSLESNFPLKHFQLIKDVFSLEMAKSKMFADAKSFSLNHIKNILKFEQKVALLNMSEDEFNNQSLIFDEDIRIIDVKWNWSRFNKKGVDQVKILTEFLNSKPKKIKLLLCRDINNNIIEEKLDDFGLLTHTIFKVPVVIRDSAKKYLDSFKANNLSDNDKIVDYAKQYMSYYIKKSLLLWIK
jgi:lantibiotic modifying enzyme